MESLGFLDAPFDSSATKPSPHPTTVITTRTGRRTGSHVQDLWDNTEIHAPALVDWAPRETSRGLDKRNFRWSVFVVFLLMITGASAFAYWLYQRPAELASNAVAVVISDATELSETLDPVALIAVHLGEDDLPAGYTDDLLAADAAARSLFTASAELVSGDDGRRALAADAAGAALDATRRIENAIAFRMVLEPALVLPQLETDPDLVDLATAVQEFGIWRAQLDELSAGLPHGVDSELLSSFDSFRASLAITQASYVDGLRTGDGTATTVVEQTETELAALRAQISDSFRAVSNEISVLISDTQTQLDSLGAR